MTDTVKTIHSEADALVCLNIRDTYPFAVASAYRNWYDLTDSEVMHLLNANNLSLVE
jgi:predicted phosphoribosyltransferase